MRRVLALVLAVGWVASGLSAGETQAAPKRSSISHRGAYTLAARPVLLKELSELSQAVAVATRLPQPAFSQNEIAENGVPAELKAGVQARLAEAKDYLLSDNHEQFADSLAQAFVLLYYPNEGNLAQCRIWKARREQIASRVENGLTLMQGVQTALRAE